MATIASGDGRTQPGTLLNLADDIECAPGH
jgi:hypothetical protein